MSGFQGFPKELIAFFEDLKENNSKEWFDNHKQDYEDFVKQPSIEFVISVGEKLKQIVPRVNALPLVNKSLFRINRDTRFSRDKSPYKTNLGLWFWEGNRARMECPGFYFHLEDRNLMLGAGQYNFTPELLQKYREAVVDDKLGSGLRRAVNSVARNGYTIRGRHYKRAPRGFDPEHKRADLLRHNGLSAMYETKLPKEFFSPALVDYAFGHYKNMLPIHKWLLKALD